MAGDQSVALQIAQGQGEHTLGDVADCAVKLAEALRSRREGHDHEYAPFVADAVEHASEHTISGDPGCSAEARPSFLRLLLYRRRSALCVVLSPVDFAIS
jgi:hypothetical protein